MFVRQFLASFLPILVQVPHIADRGGEFFPPGVDLVVLSVDVAQLYGRCVDVADGSGEPQGVDGSEELMRGAENP